MVILSDANTVFIEHVLQAQSLEVSLTLGRSCPALLNVTSLLLVQLCIMTICFAYGLLACLLASGVLAVQVSSCCPGLHRLA